MPLTWLLAALALLVLGASGAAYAVAVRHGGAADATAEAFGFPLTPAERFAATARLSNEMEESVAACMRARGHEYSPALIDIAGDTARYGYDLTPEEYASTFGFGLAEGFLRSMDAPSSSASASYSTPAAGPDLDACRERAREELPAADRTLLEQIEAYDAARGQIESALRSDPELRRLNEQWSRCMAARGYTATDEEDLVRQESAAFDALLADLGASLVPGPSGAPSLTPDARARVEAFRDAEIAAAEASLACRSSLGDAIDEAEARVVRETLGATAP
ncbi:MAG: hypothetical protein D6683_15970 [Actinomyces sp.]|nr:MAG: hypothetical protein D6683_15970 [Actinomyces sp.]